MDQHQYAAFERRVKTVNTAVRMFWIPVDFKEYMINVGVQVKNEQDVEHLSMLDLTKSLDNISQDVVQSNILELILVSDTLYHYIASQYTSHDVTVDVTNFNQPVLSTTYPANPPL
jgi:hypothetical protein